MTIATIFDTETTGANTKADPTDPGTATCLQLYAAMFEYENDQPFFDEAGKFLLTPIQEIRAILMCAPDLFVHPKAEEIHGISAARANAVGVAQATASYVLHDFLTVSDRLVAHNIGFDTKIARRLFHVTGLDHNVVDKPQPFCTMEYLKPVMRMEPKRFGDWKMPKLIEAYNYLFGKDFEGNAHDAAVDASACAHIYFRILQDYRDGEASA